jgi:glycosyltransferase involved in cell wall biosynthesis
LGQGFKTAFGNFFTGNKMRILNIGFDKTLVGGAGSGDAVARHREYGEFLDSLDIIVYTTAAENLPVFKISENVTGYPTNSKSKFGFIFDALKIAGKIRETRAFDLVVAQDPFGPAFVGFMLKQKYGVKLQINFHGDFWDNPYWLKHSAKNRVLIPLSKFLVRRADGIRVVSSGIRDKLIKFGVSADKIALLPTPVNFEEFSKFDAGHVQQIRQSYAGRKIVLYVGRFSPEKNLPWLIQIFSGVRKEEEAVLVLAGSGGEEKELRDKAKHLGLEADVVFSGSLAPDKLSDYYHACDVVVLPSFTESFGKVLVEAAICGKPVVTTKTTGALDIVADSQSGYLVEIGDTEKFIQKILEILSDEALAKKMGEAGRRLVTEKFDRNKIVAGIVQFWKKLIGSQS